MKTSKSYDMGTFKEYVKKNKRKVILPMVILRNIIL